MGKARVLVLWVVTIVLAACQPVRGPAAAGRSDQPAPSVRQGQGAETRTLTMAVRYETVALAPKATTAQGVNAMVRIFNAGLSYLDGSGVVRAYLLDSLPQVNTDTWRVLPEGKMEVTYRLREGLTWHDGKPLTADDLVFAHRSYTAPGLGLFTPRPQNFMEDVEARDARTLVIRWDRLYPDAAYFRPGDFEPLPRHILEGPFSRFQQDPAAEQDAFRNLPYWTHEYVGAGPFKLERWEPGSELEGVAFNGHALGRPKIDRLIIRIVADENTALSNLLSENIDLATDLTLRYEHGKVLLSNWETSKRGVVLLYQGTFNYTMTQFRPEFQKTPALLDVRVRKALAHAIDRPALNEGLFDSRGFMTETNIPDSARYYPQLEQSMARYEYDPRRTEQLMADAGFVKDRSGFFASASGERFRPDFWTVQSPLYERQQAIMAETWSRAGIDTNSRVHSAAQLRDFETAVTFSGLSTRLLGGGEASLPMFTSAQIGSPANRWLGNNRGGWNSSEFDELFDRYTATLDRSERDRQVIAMMRLTSEHVPVFPLYFNIDVLGHLSKVRGPAAGDIDRLTLWNVHEWELR